MLWADRSEIEIILNNLVSNAIKYNREGGRVDVQVAGSKNSAATASRRHGHWHESSGSRQTFPGIHPHQEQKTRNVLGSGLGLSILKKLVVLYGGRSGGRKCSRRRHDIYGDLKKARKAGQMRLHEIHDWLEETDPAVLARLWQRADRTRH